MTVRVIHLASVAGATRKLLEYLGCRDAAELIARVQTTVGDGYRVEGDAGLIEAGEDDDHGGRTDDAERAASISRVFADERVAAWVALRGGAWLTRILGRIDFDALRRRSTPLAMFGFSELTTLLNIAAQYPRVLSVHDLGPGFIRAGLNDYARLHPDQLSEPQARDRFPQEFMSFFADVCGIVEGRGSPRRITGELVAGTLPPDGEAAFVGGNLAVLVTLLGTPFQQAVDPADRWLLIEDINESPERVDRRLAQLQLAGFFRRCAGLLIGDFREKDSDHQPAVLELLRYHLPPDRVIPVITTHDVGHVWPMAPLPLHRPVRMKRSGFEVEFSAFNPGSPSPGAG